MLNEMPVKKIVRTKSAPRLISALGMVLIGVGLLVFGLRGVTQDKVYIRTPKMLIHAEVADDEAERVQGLSGRNSLNANSAMLIVFDEPGIHGIWMKDMRFAIDIVWLDNSKKVIAIQSNAKPDSYPKVFEPKVKSLFVIELGMGQASKLGIKVGQILSW